MFEFMSRVRRVVVWWVEGGPDAMFEEIIDELEDILARMDGLLESMKADEEVMEGWDEWSEETVVAVVEAIEREG